MARTHDVWCSRCQQHWSPLDLRDPCPVCGSEGVYDPDGQVADAEQLQREVQRALRSDTGQRGRLADLARAHGLQPEDFHLD